MNKNILDPETAKQWISQATSGDKEALETLLLSVQDIVFNLSLRMLGTVPDAEDATQDILIRIMTSLSTFRGESTFRTWVYRLTVNYLLNYKKSMFAQHPLDFEFYGNDIRYAKLDETETLVDELSREAFAEELKLSCTNVMLQCLDAESRCIFVLGTMFRVDSHLAGEILGMTAENYRQRLSRIRRKMANFLGEFCGLTGNGACSCRDRVGYAISQGRIHPERLEFTGLHSLPKETLFQCKEEMEKLDELACSFEQFPCYKSTVSGSVLIEKLLNSEHWKRMQQY